MIPAKTKVCSQGDNGRKTASQVRIFEKQAAKFTIYPPANKSEGF